MNSYALGIQYNGAQYSGFQRQSDAATVQETLEAALSRIADEPVQVNAAGRTDAGVHATQQVVSFSTESERSETAWVRGTNTYLPDDIAVIWSRPVKELFHARFSALWRRYCFIYGRQDDHQVFEEGLAAWVSEPLNLEKMQKAAQVFLGEQDFSSVRASQCSSTTPYRYVYQLDVVPVHNFVVIDVVANAFLLHMARNIAAVLRAVGSGRMRISDVSKLMMARDRTLAPPTAKPEGLYLTDVGYDSSTGVETISIVPSVVRSNQYIPRPVRLPTDYFQRAVAK